MCKMQLHVTKLLSFLMFSNCTKRTSIPNFCFYVLTFFCNFSISYKSSNELKPNLNIIKVHNLNVIITNYLPLRLQMLLTRSSIQSSRLTYTVDTLLQYLTDRHAHTTNLYSYKKLCVNFTETPVYRNIKSSPSIV